MGLLLLLVLVFLAGAVLLGVGVAQQRQGKTTEARVLMGFGGLLLALAVALVAFLLRFFLAY